MKKLFGFLTRGEKIILIFLVGGAAAGLILRSFVLSPKPVDPVVKVIKPANQSLVSLPVAEVKKGPEKEFEKKTLKSEDVKIDINAAGVNELTRLPGVGLATAENIVRYREENGPFLSVDSLMSVKGIGASKLKRIASAAVVR